MRPRLPPLESLRFVEACVRHASFTHAAAELGVTPAAVSQRIRDLEADLGCALFLRRGPRVSATPRAQALAATVRDALASLSAGVATCRASADPVRVTVVPTLAVRWLAPRLPRYGGGPVELDAAVELRGRRDFDLAIRTGDGAWPGFRAIALLPVLATAMLAPALVGGESAEGAAALHQAPLLPHPDWRRWLHAAGIDLPSPRFVSSDYPTHELDAAAALAGAGAALLCPLLFEETLTERKLIQLLPVVIAGPQHHFLLVHDGERRRPVLCLAEWIDAQAQATRDTLASRGVPMWKG